MTIIRDRNAVSEASNADLLETYNAMTGKDIKKFSSRAAAESQTSNAIMIGEERAAHLGVKKGAKPVAVTVAEAEARRAAKGQQAPASAQEAQNAPKPTPTPKGSLRERLSAKAGDAAPNKPRPKPEKKEPGGERAAKLDKVRLIPNRDEVAASGVRDDSARGKVLAAMRYGRGNKVWTVDELAEAVGFNVRPALTFLVRHSHVERAE